jgi:hypothetical protein
VLLNTNPRTMTDYNLFTFVFSVVTERVNTPRCGDCDYAKE